MQRTNITPKDLFPACTQQADSLHKIVAYFDLTSSKNNYQETDQIWLLRKSNAAGFLSLTSMPYKHYRRHFEGRSKRDYSAREVKGYTGQSEMLYHRWRLYFTSNGWRFISIFMDKSEHRAKLSKARSQQIVIDADNQENAYQSLTDTLKNNGFEINHLVKPDINLTKTYITQKDGIDYVNYKSSKSLSLLRLMRESIENPDSEESSEEDSAERAKRFMPT